MKPPRPRMKLQLIIEEEEIRERLLELNEERRCRGERKATLRELRRLLKDPRALELLADYHLSECIEMLA